MSTSKNTGSRNFVGIERLNLSILDATLQSYLLGPDDDDDANGSSSSSSSSSRKPRPLTALEVERRETEIELLRQLRHGNGASQELWQLWYHEKGKEGAAQLQWVEHCMAALPGSGGSSTAASGGSSSSSSSADDGPRWEDAEITLFQLIRQHGTTWVEPINRLATLYYIQGRIQEAEVLCHVVITLKPWHFGALSGLVAVYAARHELDQARHWAARRLPSWQPPSSSSQSPFVVGTNSNNYSNNMRRHQWVQEATRQARFRLQQQLQQGNEWWGPLDLRRRQQQQQSHGQDLLFPSTDTTIFRQYDDSGNDNGRSSYRDFQNNINYDNNAWQ